MTIEAFKTHLIERIQQQAEWRMVKAAEYPDDDRNDRSAKALRMLASRLSNEIQCSSPRLVRVFHLWYGRDQIADSGAIDEGIARENELLRGYGFDADADGDPNSFLEGFASELQEVTDV